MSWFLADDQLAHSEGVMLIPKRYRPAAMGVWLLCGAWLSSHLNSDRYVPMEQVRLAGGTALLTEHLVSAGFWVHLHGGVAYTLQGCRVGTTEAVQAARASTAQRVREHRARAREQPDLQGNDNVTVLRPVPVTEPPGVVPSYTTPHHTKEGGLGSQVTTARSKQEEPPPRCRLHAENASTGCRGCEAERLYREQQKQAAIEAQRAVLAACELCDDKGWLKGEDGLVLDDGVRCSHVPAGPTEPASPPQPRKTGPRVRTRRTGTATERHAQ